MPVTIREITTEVVLEPDPADERRAGALAPEAEAELVERVARAAYERVLEHLRREWGH